MTKGFVVLAQNSDINYVRQAYALALSIKATQPKIKNISLVTNDDVPNKYKTVFDKIISIPFKDEATNSDWKIENRWKIYYASPYEETIVFDSDMLVLENIQSVWKFASNYDLFFTSRVRNYRNNDIVNTTYRKMFIENNLPNLYSGMFYFKKSQLASQFFKVLELIVHNWEKSYYELSPKHMQKFCSIDASAAIAAKILGIDNLITHKSSPFTFVHLKPALQGWDTVPASCLSQLLINFNSKKELYLNNIRQYGVFHYVEDKFLTDQIIEKLNG